MTMKLEERLKRCKDAHDLDAPCPFYEWLYPKAPPMKCKEVPEEDCMVAIEKKAVDTPWAK